MEMELKRKGMARSGMHEERVEVYAFLDVGEGKFVCVKPKKETSSHFLAICGYSCPIIDQLLKLFNNCQYVTITTILCRERKQEHKLVHCFCNSVSKECV